MSVLPGGPLAARPGDAPPPSAARGPLASRAGLVRDNPVVREIWIIASLAVTVIGVAAGETVVAIIGATVLLAGLMARVSSRLAFERLEVTHALSADHAFVGEHVEYRVSVVNRKLLPLPWLELRTRMHETLEPEGRRLTPSGMPAIAYLVRRTGLRWYERVTWRYRIPMTARGHYRLGPIHLRSGDLFGLFPRESEAPATLPLWVYPEIVPLAELGLPLFRPLGERRGGNRLFEDPTRLQTLRDYRPGDPLKRVDWKASARRRSLVSRVFEPPSSPHVVLALNVSTLEEAWRGFAVDLFERAVTTAASLAAQFAEAQQPYGLLANCTLPNQHASIRVAAGRSHAHSLRVLEALAMVSNFQLLSAERLLAEEATRLPVGSTVVLVTAVLTPAMVDALQRLRRHGHGAAVVYVASDEPAPALGPIPLHCVAPAFERMEWRRAPGRHSWAATETVAPAGAPAVEAGSPWARPTAGPPGGNGGRP